MKKITQEELAERLELHARWRNGGEGQRMDLSGMDLRGMDLRSVNLSGANLTHTTMVDAIMVDADLTSATMVGANLTGANLTGALMMKANLTLANLTLANLTGAILSDVGLTGANLPQGMRAGKSLGYSWMLYADGCFRFGCETHSVADWLGGMAETLSQRWIGAGWEQFSCEIRRILGAC